MALLARSFNSSHVSPPRSILCAMSATRPLVHKVHHKGMLLVRHAACGRHFSHVHSPMDSLQRSHARVVYRVFRAASGESHMDLLLLDDKDVEDGRGEENRRGAHTLRDHQYGTVWTP
jgi:hypothetical protein